MIPTMTVPRRAMTLLETIAALAILALMATSAATLSRDASITFEAVRQRDAWLVAAERVLDAIERAIVYGDVSIDVEHRTELAYTILEDGASIRMCTWPTVVLPGWPPTSHTVSSHRADCVVTILLRGDVLFAGWTAPGDGVERSDAPRELLRNVARFRAESMPGGGIRIEVERLAPDRVRGCSAHRTINQVRRVLKEEWR